MKKYLLLLVLATALAACGGHQSHKEAPAEQSAAPAEDKEHTSAYVCPMYCPGSGSEEPGKCPVCGMDYVKNENQQH